jgi:integrase-like protein
VTSGKPIENAYVESFNGRFRDECLNEHWFLSVAEARTIIEGLAPRLQHGTAARLTRAADARGLRRRLRGLPAG